MDPTQQRLMKKDDAVSAEDGTSPGPLLVGAVVLLVGGIGLVSLANASVADVGGGMLILIGLALGAASVWISSQRG